jgi:hypothetical protein
VKSGTKAMLRSETKFQIHQEEAFFLEDVIDCANSHIVTSAIRPPRSGYFGGCLNWLVKYYIS